MYEISVKKSFSAAHYLRNYKGKCEGLHGHNWKVMLCVFGKKLSENGMLFDFTELKKILSGILSDIDHKNLNDIPPFNKINPSAENIAKFIFGKIKSKIGKMANAKIRKISVWESESSRADYFE